MVDHQVVDHQVVEIIHVTQELFLIHHVILMHRKAVIPVKIIGVQSVIAVAQIPHFQEHLVTVLVGVFLVSLAAQQVAYHQQQVHVVVNIIK